MKKSILAFLVVIIAFAGHAQTGPGATPLAVETLHLIPKRGMEEKFEAAVLAHIKKHHPEGAYYASLRRIEYGPKAGWYVWIMGPTAFETLDKPLGKDNGHEQDWNTTIDPLVEEYGPTSLWSYSPDLSYGLDIVRKAKHYEIWSVDLKSGQYYRFKAIAEKLKKAYEAIGNIGFLVLDNAIHSAEGSDVALVWSFDTYGSWSNDPGPKAQYEKLNGEGSWQRMLDEWMDIVNDYNSEIRTGIR